MNWSEEEPMSPSLFQSVPLYCSEEAETRISLIRTSELLALTSLTVVWSKVITVLVLWPRNMATRRTAMMSRRAMVARVCGG